ncbi:LCP family protein [Planctomonas sp. JC2975]|uniref:LCP family glycopolymer transferase n=1 Tax=Planctomonas sp. JC2975 TaxID=2729626 RepID=UPI001473BE70|nr:LCP family protein [Planctomonas sp. JC2975]
MTYYKNGKPLDPKKIARINRARERQNTGNDGSRPAPSAEPSAQRRSGTPSDSGQPAGRSSSRSPSPAARPSDPYELLEPYREPKRGRASATPPAAPPDPATARKRKFRRRRIIAGIAAAVVLVVVGAGIIVFTQYQQLSSGIHRTSLGPAQNTAETNILVMGLDSRLDENGNPLPADVYNALHAGTSDDGGYNSNVLMLLHIPAGGGHPVGISIPRDDWVSLPGSPDGVSMGKIKQAYGYQLDATLTHLVNTQPNLSHADAYQQARSAARVEEVNTVSQFLNVKINHFVEVTMGAFYQLAEAVQPIQVCLNAATADSYSGADFTKGLQEINAAQAVAFVRQRRDTTTSDVNLTDLDRERRQQAFIISLANKLQHQNLFDDFTVMEKMLGTVKNDIAVDSNLDLLSLASDAKRFGGGGVSFETLPISSFGYEDGQDVNLVDLDQVRATTAQLIAASDASSTATAHPSASTGSGSGSGSSGTGSSGSSGSGSSGSGSSGSGSAPSNTFGTGGVMSSSSIPCVN